MTWSVHVRTCAGTLCEPGTGSPICCCATATSTTAGKPGPACAPAELTALQAAGKEPRDTVAANRAAKAATNPQITSLVGQLDPVDAQIATKQAISDF